ncbi:DNA-directed RNA polymerase subunit RPC12/RpoP [Desulfitispora alkaliphila]|uniref:hypothetical protein n=1 Tax=Desulfitispora alkaliphila TaxID=622674 RepID=UPI003D1BAB4C
MSKYGCAKCGKESGLPDFCCGNSMAAKGNFACKNCGKAARESQKCCNEDMVKV